MKESLKLLTYSGPYLPHYGSSTASVHAHAYICPLHMRPSPLDIYTRYQSTPHLEAF